MTNAIKVIEGHHQKLRVFQKAEAALRVHLPFVAFQHLLRRQMRGVKFIGGQDETTVLVDKGLPGGERRGQSPVDLVDHLSGSGIRSGSTPLDRKSTRLNSSHL